MSIADPGTLLGEMAIALGSTEEDHEEPCQRILGCSRVAVWRVTFSWSCSCWPPIFLYCDPHGQPYRERVGRPSACRTCDAPALIASVTPKGKS